MGENVMSLSDDNAELIAKLVLQELVGKDLLVIQGDRQTHTKLKVNPWGEQVWVSPLPGGSIAITVNTEHLMRMYRVPAPGQPSVLFIFNPGEIRVERTVNGQPTVTVYKVIGPLE